MPRLTFAVVTGLLAIAHLLRDVWGVVTVHATAVIAANTETGRRVGTLGEVHAVAGASPRQQAYLSRPHIAALQNGVVCLYGRLVPPSFAGYDWRGRRINEISLERLVPPTALGNARSHYAHALPEGQLSYSETATALAAEPDGTHLLIGLASPLMSRVDLDGRVLATFIPVSQDGREVALTDIAMADAGTGYAISGSLGVFAFDLPASVRNGH